MPRSPRKLSESGVYHVMVRGIAQAQLFYDDADREAFLERLQFVKDTCGFKIYAWCLMGNHVHLIVDVSEATETLSSIMKRLLVRYARYFNSRYDRVGYLYQSRFESRPIEDDSYLLTAVRYVHRNPLEAGNSICHWTSYDAYMGRAYGQTLTDVGFVLRVLSPRPEVAVPAFSDLVLNAEVHHLPSWTIPARVRLSDAEAKKVIEQCAGIDECLRLVDLPSDRRVEAIRQSRMRHCSVRQIARLTGLTKRMVELALAA